MGSHTYQVFTPLVLLAYLSKDRLVLFFTPHPRLGLFSCLVSDYQITQHSALCTQIPDRIPSLTDT